MSVYIIAEAGVNHNGSVETAKKMIEKAKESGCDCIKFQTFRADSLVTRDAQKADYQIANTKNDDTQYQMLRKLELTYEDFSQLKKYCDEIQIDFMSTPFDEDSADMLNELGVMAFKISSGDITNKRLLEHVAKMNRPVILSTGMCTMQEVAEAVGWIENRGNSQITLLHCTSNYPTKYEEVNMNAMLSLADEFSYPVGYSDHTPGIVIPVMAVAMGATVIEKHFTLDRNMEGPDHRASLEPQELSMMADAIRKVEAAKGDGIKKPAPGELSTRDVARKSVVLCRTLEKGHVLKKEDLDIKRPGTGIPPKYLDQLPGRILRHDMEKDTLLHWEDVEI